jgi:Asp-tRNA(Asn)/Glu-tRNA(Gln) amidotransferase A subunit family amidase
MNVSNPLNRAGLAETLRRIEAGECTAVDVINACFDRIDAREDKVGAWECHLSRADYLQQYHDQQAFYEQSLLKGLPVGIKDIIDTADMPTEMGSAIHAGRQPIEDASCVALVKAAGGMVLGKTVTTEFAYFRPGKTCNPHALDRTPGGSSSGSAAAVADEMVPMALGSQTAASVIRPAAYCGAVGYVGSRGEFSLRGGQPLAQSLDSLGLFARHVEDIQLLRAVLLRLPAAELPAAVKPRRIVMCAGDNVGDTDADMNTALQQVAERLQAAGVEVTWLEAGTLLQQMVMHHSRIMAWEVCRNLVMESQQAELLSQPLQELIKDGLAMPREDYLASLDAVETSRHWLWSTCAEADAILAPAAPGVAPLGLDKTGAPHMSRPWQAMGFPVISIPGETDGDHLPLGLQLVGRARQDDALLQVAAWVEQNIMN